MQGNEKLKDIPEVFRTRYQLDKEENLDATVQKITDEWTALKQGLVSSGQYVEAPKATSKADEQNDLSRQCKATLSEMLRNQSNSYCLKETFCRTF